MAFHHVTIGAEITTDPVNYNFALESVTLTSVGLSATRQAFGFPAFAFNLGLTPPGDEAVQVYESLLRGLLSSSDGLVWTGSIRIRDPLFLVLNYISRRNYIIILTWTTSQ